MTTNSKLDKLVIGFLTIGVSTALLSFLFASATDDPIAGNPTYQHALIVIYGVAAIYALAHFRQVFEMITRSKPLLLLIIMALISPAWAEHPNMVFRRALFMVGCTVVGVLLAVRFTASERLSFLRFLLRSLSIGCLLCVMLFPAYGIGYLKTNDNMVHGEWNGVFVAKNRLGAVVGLSALIDSYFVMSKWETAFWYGLYFILLIKSDSMTPVGALIATYVVLHLYRWLRARYHLSDRAITIIIGAILIPITSLGLWTGLFQEALGKDSSLSGRATIWRLSAPLIFEHPILGFGYDGLFRGASDEFYTISSQMNWPVPAAHNGYLEIALDLGLAGTILMLWFLAQSSAAALRRVRTVDGPAVSFPLALVVYFLVSNIAEGTILSSTIMWTVVVATVLDILPAHRRVCRESSQACEAINVNDAAMIPG
jgi:O-antigen ligase